VTGRIASTPASRPARWSPARWLYLAAAAVVAGVAVAAVAGRATTTVMLVVASGLLGTASAVPTIRDTVRGRATPPLVTWGTWTLITALAGAASVSSRDYPAAVYSFVGTVATGTVVLVAVRTGDRTFGRLDIICITLIVPALIWWLTSRQPAAAVIGTCVIDLIGLVPAIALAWHHPARQSAATFALIAVGGVCATGAAWGTWTITAVGYPIYIAVSAGAMTLLTRRQPTTEATSSMFASPPTGGGGGASLGEGPRKTATQAKTTHR
jgi:hypothetical protein